MVTTPHYDLDIDTTLGGNDASDYVIPSQKAIKAYVDNNSGGGGSITVDQTYDGTSTNAQSGVAIEGAGFVKNTASNPTGSITLLGSATSGSSAVNIGVSSTASSYCAVLGANATTGGFYSTAIGCNASTSSTNSTAVGYWATASYKYATAVGNGATASADTTVAVGTSSVANYARATSIGQSSNATADSATALGAIAKATANNAIQIGYGTNNTANTLNIGFYNSTNTHYNWQLLDGTTGLIPDARISSNIARTSAIPTIDQTYDSTSANAQSGVAIAGAGFLQTKGNITSSTVLTNLETGIYTVDGVTHAGFPNPSQAYYGVLIQYGGTYKPQLLVAGVPASNGLYYRRYLTGSSSFTAWGSIPTVPTNISAFTNDSGYITSSALSNYLQATNGNTAYTNTGTETTMGYTDTNTGEMYGVLTGYTYYGTGVILGAQSSTGGYVASVTVNGLSLINGATMATSVLTVDSSNNLCINGEVMANTHLNNLSVIGKGRIDGQWVDANEGIISSATSLSGSTALTKRITLPDDGYKYEVLIRGSIYTSSTSGKEVFLKVKGNEDSYDRYIARCITRTSSAMYSSGTTLVTASYVASNQTNLTIARDSSWGGNCSELTVVAYRRIGTNT